VFVTVELQIVHERETLELFDIRAGDKVPQLVRQRFHWGNVFSQSLMDAISVGTKQMILNALNTYARLNHRLGCLKQNARKQQQQQEQQQQERQQKKKKRRRHVICGRGRSSSATAKLLHSDSLVRRPRVAKG
jgi:hypothetical protein